MYKEGCVMNKFAGISIGVMTFVLCSIGLVYWYYSHHNQSFFWGTQVSMKPDFINGQVCNKQTKDSGAPFVEKKVLANGMTILVRPIHSIPKVSLQIWYNVGSKDEETGEKGIAHLIEHMIFKGTAGKSSLHLSESDINTITHMLSGSCNAFTAQDFTGYSFDMPSHTWKEALPIMADCMVNAAFKDDHLNSEMKAVIQELKMRKDRYQLSLAEELMTTIFADHPYHYPIIGYKQDLWNVHADDLRAFYKKHYWPNNATLVIVGDVDPHEAFDLAQTYFGPLKANEDYRRPQFYFNKDIISKEVTLYRDVAQPFELMGFVIPGASAKNKAIVDITSLLLGSGKGSRLYKKIVDEQHLATSLTSFYWDILFEYSVFFIAFEPTNRADIPRIQAIIQEEIDSIIDDGLQPQELTRAIKQARMDFYNTLEDIHQQAYDIGKFFVATGDENYIYNYLCASDEQVENQVRAFLQEYFRPSLMHKGHLLPLPEREKQTWANLQKLSDLEDTRFLSARARTSSVEAPNYAKKIHVQEATKFDFPKASELVLPNGLKVVYYNNENTPKITLELRLKAQNYYDSEQLPGLYNFMAAMISEGTENYTASQLTHELESRGISFVAGAGQISMSMLSADLEKGLELLMEILTKATFAQAEIEKVRAQILVDIKNFWDNPSYFANQLIKEQIYKGHPYSKNTLGTQESVAAVTREDLVALYKQFISPDGATMAIVGDLRGYDLKAVLEKSVGHWKGAAVKTIVFPVLTKKQHEHIEYPINRNQVLLAYAGLSIDRKNPDYDKLLIFDQILGGGVLGSMKSRLFKLREQSGLFYSINGSLTAQANEQPGMVMIKTMVSLDRLAEAEKAIKDTLKTVADHITQEEFNEAKNAILNSLMQNFETNATMANAFLFLDKYGLPGDYFDSRAAKLEMITIPQVQDAVKRVLNADELMVLKIGRMAA